MHTWSAATLLAYCPSLHAKPGSVVCPNGLAAVPGLSTASAESDLVSVDEASDNLLGLEQAPA